MHFRKYYTLTYDLQKDGKNRTKTAKFKSTRSIEKDKIHLDISETSLKFPLGPIMSPRPGPTLDMVAAPEIADRKSRPEIDSNIAIIKEIKKDKKI